MTAKTTLLLKKRLAAGLDRYEAAELLGISTTSLSLLENNKTETTRLSYLRLLEIFPGFSLRKKLKYIPFYKTPEQKAKKIKAKKDAKLLAKKRKAGAKKVA